jgi:ABC-type transport system involved in cytochrome bd biosynthesis fused ATPase/permease subunit
MESTELNWHEAQRRQSELTAFSQALMMLIGGVAVIAMLWLASGDIGETHSRVRLLPFSFSVRWPRLKRWLR